MRYFLKVIDDPAYIDIGIYVNDKLTYTFGGRSGISTWPFKINEWTEDDRYREINKPIADFLFKLYGVEHPK